MIANNVAVGGDGHVEPMGESIPSKGKGGTGRLTPKGREKEGENECGWMDEEVLNV